MVSGVWCLVLERCLELSVLSKPHHRAASHWWQPGAAQLHPLQCNIQSCSCCSQGRPLETPCARNDTPWPTNKHLYGNICHLFVLKRSQFNGQLSNRRNRFVCSAGLYSASVPSGVQSKGWLT